MLAACGTPTATPAPQVTGTSAPAVPTAINTTVPASPTPLPTATPGPQIFTIGLPSAPGVLDPANAADSVALLMTRHMYEGLTQFAPGTTRAEPALAETWATSDDGLTWTFNLRSDVRFTDGTPLTAEVAAQNFNRWLTRTPPGPYPFVPLMLGGFAGQTDEAGAPLTNIQAISATTPSTLVLTLYRPDASLPNTLAMPAFALMSPAWENAAGTGPFQLKRQSGALIELERNPDYWGTPAKPDGLVFKIIPDAVQRRTALQVNEIDGYAGVEASDYGLSAQWPITVTFDAPLQVLYLGFNQARAPWGNTDCRLAVALAVDKARYVQSFFPGDAEIATTLQAGLNVTDRERDVAQAQALWAACLQAVRLESGPPPETVNLYVPPIPRAYLPNPANLGAALQADLAEVGISVTVQSPDWATQFLPEVQAGRADLFLLGWYAPNGDPDGYLCPLFCGQNAAFNTDNGGLPIPPDAELATLLLQARLATDPAQRADLYTRAHARIFETLPALPLAARKTAWAFRSDFRGYALGPLESLFFELEVVSGP
ncbi:MAG: hypothetical protein JNL09_05155 [Anaerolineales bacterium]|nr:hypothetical protein [Anaerolineales bacterium]